MLSVCAGENWGEINAPNANRFIFSHDRSNAEMKMLETLVLNVKDFDPELIVLSGLHMMEGQEEEERDRRLQEVRQVPELTGH